MTSTTLDAQGKRFTPEPGKASIYINRGSGVGTAVPLETMLDGRVAGSLAPNTYQLLSVKPGEHVVSTGSGFENVEQVKLNAMPSKNYFLKAGILVGWVKPRAHITQVDEATGRAAVSKSKRAEAAVY